MAPAHIARGRHYSWCFDCNQHCQKAKEMMRRLIWDIETSPNIVFSWRTGGKLYIDPDNIIQERAIICICYKWEGEKKVYSLEWNKGCDKKMVKTFLKIAEQADELVAHNGDKFDIKWLNTRALFHGFDPSPIHKTVDTLVIARRRFNFNSNRLDYLGKYLLNDGKVSTSFSMWWDIVKNNCPKAMIAMVKYCKSDVRLLEQIWKKLEPYHNPKSHVGVMNGNEKWSCARCGSEDVHRNRERTSSRGVVTAQMRCKSCKCYYTISLKSAMEYSENKK